MATSTLDATGAATYTFDLTWELSQAQSLEGVTHVHTGSIAATLFASCWMASCFSASCFAASCLAASRNRITRLPPLDLGIGPCLIFSTTSVQSPASPPLAVNRQNSFGTSTHR